MIAPFFSKRLLLSLIAMASLAAQGPQPGPQQVVLFTGKSIPDPPQQKQPWTPPRTKLPRFLVSATSALFEQGMADPRGCDYREVERLGGPAIKTRAFVLPEKPGEPGRFAVGWDGVVHPVSTVGPAADLDADIRALADSMRIEPGVPAGGRMGRGPGPAIKFISISQSMGIFGMGGASDPGDRSALKLCLLLRLGRADLAECLFAAGTSWTPEIRGRDLTDYQMSYLTLAREWAARMFNRLVGAHMRGDDPIALDAARRLSAFATAAETRALEMGFARDPNGFGNEIPSFFPFLSQLPALLADHERRAREAPRGPVPPTGTDPAARVAALIRDLDQIAMPQMIHFGNSPNGSPLVQELAAEGDAAVEPLLAAIESDTRMTRTVSSRGGICRVHTVYEPEFAALTAILKTQQFQMHAYQPGPGTLSRKELAEAMRAYWMKNRALSMSERWYRTLLDDSSGYYRWLEAASNIVQLEYLARPVVRPADLQGAAAPAKRMKGEELRSRRDPSVSELLARRTLEIAHAPQPRTFPNVKLQNACALAMLLQQWDLKAALPVIRTLLSEARESIDQDRASGSTQLDTMMGYVAQFALILARAGEPAALAEYAAEIRKYDVRKSQPNNLDVFEPIWTFPEDPAIREASQWLFNDPGSSFAALIRKPESNRLPFFFHSSFYDSPLLRSTGFRKAVLEALAIRTEVGTARRSQQTLVQYELKGGVSGAFGASVADLEGVLLDENQKIRTCDYIAWKVSGIEGTPRCELYWTKELRDAAVGACVEFLKTYGDRLTPEPPPGVQAHPFEKRAYLAFPVLDRPATIDDVRAGRAIFSLEGQGEVRRIALPTTPMKAKWTPAEEAPGDLAVEGWVWQAEEIRRDGQWERFYGFVGRHVIGRVQGISIELAGQNAADPGN